MKAKKGAPLADTHKDDLKPKEKQPIGSLNKLNSELL